MVNGAFTKKMRGDDWYSFQGSSSFNGNGTIKVKLQQNDLTKVRVVNLVLKTKEAEGAEVVTNMLRSSRLICHNRKEQ